MAGTTKSVVLARDSVEKRKVGLFGSIAGKGTMADDLIALFPAHKTYTEVFAGGGAVFWSKDKSEVEALNDFDSEVAFAYKFAQQITDDQIAKLEKFDWIGTKDLFQKIRQSQPTDPLKRFHRFIYLRKAGFARTESALDSKVFDRHVAKTLFKRLPMFRERLSGVKITCGDFLKPLQKYDAPDALHFLDPPFPGFKFNIGEGDWDEKRFLKAMYALKGSFILTYETRPELNKEFRARGYKVREWLPKENLNFNSNQATRQKTTVVTNFEKRAKSVQVPDFPHYDRATKISIGKSHSRTRCMECKSSPRIEVLWADGRGRAWFCDPCFKTWKSAEREIVSEREVDGEVGLRWNEPAKKMDSLEVSGLELETTANHAKKLAGGELSLILDVRKHAIDGQRLVLTDGVFDYGVLELHAPEKIDTWKFSETIIEHGLTESDRKKRWPHAKHLWAYPVAKMYRFKQPLEKGNSELSLTEDSAKAVQKVQSLANRFADLAPGFAERSIEMLSGIDGRNEAVEFLRDMPQHARLFASELGRIQIGAVEKSNATQTIKVASNLAESLSDVRFILRQSLGDCIDQGASMLQKTICISEQNAPEPQAKSVIAHEGDVDLGVLAENIRPVLVQQNAVTAIGGLANRGITKGDVELLITNDDGSLKHQLLNSLPDSLSQRVQVADGGDVVGPNGQVGLYDLWLVPHGQQVEHETRDLQVVQMADVTVEKIESCVDTILKSDALMRLPKSRGKRRAVYQYHFCNKSLHGDLRLQLDDMTIGWTISNQRPGKILDVREVKEARRFARRFKKSGSHFECDWSDGLLATPKGQAPMVWMEKGNEIIEAGEIGAGIDSPGVLSRVTDPSLRVEYGLQTSVAHEYFFTGDPSFDGRMVVKLYRGESPSWRAVWKDDLTPLVLDQRAMATKTMPPDGYSGLPVSIEKLIPSEFRYWEARGEVARQMRDELIASGFITKGNLRIVNGEFQRVIHKMFLDHSKPVQKTTSRYGIAWQFWKGQQASRPSRECWHLIVDSGDRTHAWKLRSNPLEGDELVGGVYRSIGSSELLKFDGEVRPMTKIGGEDLNGTNSTSSWIRNLDTGLVEVLDKNNGAMRVRFRGKMRGIYSMQPEEPGSDFWLIEAESAQKAAISDRGAGAQVFVRRGELLKHVECPPCGSLNLRVTKQKHLDRGRSMGVVECNDCSAHFAPAHTNEIKDRNELLKRFDENELSVSELESVDDYIVIKQVPVQDGVQIWDAGTPSANNRSQLRPFARYAPMSGREFDAVDLLEKFATPTLLQIGMVVEPRHRAASVSVQKCAQRVMIWLQESTSIQTLIFDKEKFPSAEAARRWAKDHDFKSSKVDEGENSIRLRQREPGDFQEGSFRTINIREGVKAVIGRLKSAKSATDLAKHFPGLARGVRKIAGDFVLDGWLREDGTIAVTDSLYVPTAGNITEKRYSERRRRIEQMMIDIDSDCLFLSPSQVVQSRDQLQRAVGWANDYPGSEGAVIKAVDASYLVGACSDLCAVFKGNVEPDSARELFRKAFERELPILKDERANDEERFVMGIVLEPNDGDSDAPLDPDTQDDIYSAEVIRETAHKFMERFRNMGLMHNSLVNNKVKILESFIAPVEMTIGNTKIRKGTWMLAVRVLDDALWKAIKIGKLTGFSIGGSAIRKPVKEVT